MRPQSACLACRERRKRCERPLQGTSCTFCSVRKIECQMAPKPDPSSDAVYELLAHSRISASGAALSPDLAEELAALYFQNVQGGFPYLFHQPSFMASVQDGSVPLVLLYAMSGLSARFSQHPSLGDTHPWERGRRYAKEAERLLNLHNTSLTTIQTCMLLAVNFVVDGEPDTESVYFAIAARMALLLDLPNAPAKTALDREVNLRVWWSIFTTDTWSSSSLGVPRAVKSQPGLPLPVDEWTFARMSVDMPLNGDLGELVDPSMSALGQLVKLNQLLYEIYQLNTMMANDRLQVDDANDQIAALCDLIHNAREFHGVNSQYTILSHVLVLASTVQIHSLLFSVDENEIARAKVRLERNFQTLTRLYTYWPNVSASFSRLRAFHRACLKSTRSSFRLDRWMLRFMLEFSRPVDERVEDDELVEDSQGTSPFGQLMYLVHP